MLLTDGNVGLEVLTPVLEARRPKAVEGDADRDQQADACGGPGLAACTRIPEQKQYSDRESHGWLQQAGEKDYGKTEGSTRVALIEETKQEKTGHHHCRVSEAETLQHFWEVKCKQDENRAGKE
jgi:hypothetical protein